MRGINRQDIFYDEDDYQRFMGTLERLKTDKFEMYGYCLMSNHVHLLIHEASIFSRARYFFLKEELR